MTAQQLPDSEPCSDADRRQKAEDDNRRLRAQLFALKHSLKVVQHQLDQFELLVAHERAMRLRIQKAHGEQR